MKIIPLSEGSFTVDQSKQFIPFVLGKDELQSRTRGSLLVEIQPFCVVTSREVILLDTGLGFANTRGVLQIHENLAVNGISPSDVSLVLLSHLHKDHAGGIALPGKKELSFPHARYVIHKSEWDYAFEKGAPSYFTEDFALLEGSGQLSFSEGESGEITDGITYFLTGGHSLFHQAFLIEEGSEKVFYGGDVAPQLMQMKNRFKAKYDQDGNRSMELRMQWKTQGEKAHWTFLFYHDIRQPVYKF